MEESLSCLAKIKQVFDIKEVDIKTYSPLTLAYIGDAVYDLIIRTYVVEQGNKSANKLHKDAIKYVNAGAQSKLVDIILEKMTDEEMAVYHRGRNATSHTSAKNASIEDYRKATGLESLIGYLYLKDDFDRILELVSYNEFK